MNIVIILRLKKIFARPSLQENRSEPELATVATTNIAKKELRGVKTGERAAASSPKKISRAATKTSLGSIHEDIPTVSQVTNNHSHWKKRQ